ncbi:CyaA/EF/ExoY family adenylyl cyclase toxin [Cesiribacter sp. SM1]|uniref:CyaA/EF/ExoY family adenylyl cyclase toxin n=1 Tax=Cesiribacter sp. SM1 TaxID=2861196 RepID=UPI001CD35026|nr:CyaA/EF/ExoY family adenylyl cyclase toxin [Cesiribacter sp. SM1]
MIPQHKQIFFTAADHLNCYIGLRKPNDEADQWITKEGYIPKGMEVKAKSAKAGKYAGLVVNPYLRKDAFTDEKDWARAKKSWDEFTKNGLPKGYSYPTNGDDVGVLKKEGKGIHADYDLMFVNLADKEAKYATPAPERRTTCAIVLCA